MYTIVPGPYLKLNLFDTYAQKTSFYPFTIRALGTALNDCSSLEVACG